MKKSPPRLVRDDPGFARLVDAMRKDAPSEAEMSKALSLATKIAALPPVPTPGGPSWLGRTWIQGGLTIIGVSAVLGGLAAASVSHEQAAAPSAATSLVPLAPRSTSLAGASERAAASVTIEELPSAPVVSSTPAVQGTSVVKRADPPMALAKSRADVLAARPPASVAVPSAASAGGKGQTTFAEELALTSEARSSLERGDFVACMAAVDRYQRSFRSGVFAQEIDVIRIEAFAKSGQRERAHAAAERFLVTNAASPYADRVRSVFNNTKY